jgi:hypothetical protein
MASGEMIEIAIGDTVSVVKDDTTVIGRVCGLKLNGNNLDFIWIENMPEPFEIDDGWRVMNNHTVETQAQIDALNALLEGEEEEQDGEV